MARSIAWEYMIFEEMYMSNLGITTTWGATYTFGLPDRPVGLSRPQRVMNALANSLGPKRVRPLRKITSLVGAGRAQTVPLIRNIMDDAAAIVRQSGSLANFTRPQLGRAIDKVFSINRDGLITNADLLGVEGRLPGGITMKTLAARLPIYWSRLSSEQRQVMTRVRESLEKPKAWIGREEIPDATNLVQSTEEGVPNGFYVPSKVIEDTTRAGDVLPVPR